MEVSRVVVLLVERTRRRGHDRRGRVGGCGKGDLKRAKLVTSLKNACCSWVWGPNILQSGPTNALK